MKNAQTTINAAEQLTIDSKYDAQIINGKIAYKQKSTVKHINDAGKNKGTQPKKVVNDECYTDFDDIMNELENWGTMDKFRGKNIICPCDWDITDDSDIYQIHFEFKDGVITQRMYGESVYDWVKSVSFVNDAGHQIVWLDDEIGRKEITAFFHDKVKCNFIRVLFCKAVQWGIKSITASGYNPDLDKGVKFQDVDYSKYDVCITNPPFSLYEEFFDCIAGKIEFCLLAPFLNRKKVCEAKLMFTKQLYLGFGRDLHPNFVNPTLENHFATKKVACDWVVSWPEAQREHNARIHDTGITYELYKDEFSKHENLLMKDGTYPIIVPGNMIPDDYDGWMFVPVSAFDHLNTEKYEYYCTALTKFFNTDHPELSPFAGKINKKALTHNGSEIFTGFVIRKKN